MRNNLFIGILIMMVGFVCGVSNAADMEVILGTSSAFNIVRGASVSSGTSTIYVGSSTVSIGTTTQNAMFYVAGSSTSSNDASLRARNSSGTDTFSVRNDGAILIGTSTSTLNSALYVGSATSGSLGTMTAGFLSIGTVSANTSLHGTTTVRFLSDIYANGTITAGVKFVGDGSLLSGITASGGVTGGNISTSGTISAGSTTVSTLTTTGSATVSGTITAASNTFRADSGSVTVTTRVGIGTSTPSSSYRLQVTDDADLGFVVGSSGSITAKTLSATGSVTVTGTLTAANSRFKVDDSTNQAYLRFAATGIGTNTPSSSYLLQVTSDSDLGVVVGSSGSITAKTLTTTGSATVSGTLTAATASGSRVGIGTTTPSSSYLLQVTDTSDLGVVVSSGGSVTAKTITATGSATVTGPVLIGTNTPSLASALYVGSSTTGNLGTITAGFLSVGTISTNVSLHGTTTLSINGGLNVLGNLTKTSGSFVIPHPDPAKNGWMLKHCFVESPTRGDNLYRFKAVIQSDGGETSISLPSYWPHLNENPDVLVSPVGQFARCYGYVDESANKLIIRGEKKGVYSVVLIGTRKDQYAKDFFDSKGAEYRDPEMSELLTRSSQKSADNIQLINAQNSSGNKTFLDPVADTFGLAVCQ